MAQLQFLLRNHVTAALVLIGACGDATHAPEPTSVDGEVFGRSMAARSAMSGISPLYQFVGTVLRADHHAIKISDFEDSCEPPVEGVVPGQSLYMDFFLDAVSADATLSQPGTFVAWLPAIDGDLSTLPSEPFVVVTYADPSNGRGSVAQSGTVTVTRLSNGRIAGDFDVSFNSGGLSGTFDSVVLCDPWTSFSSIP